MEAGFLVSLMNSRHVSSQESKTTIALLGDSHRGLLFHECSGERYAKMVQVQENPTDVDFDVDSGECLSVPFCFPR